MVESDGELEGVYRFLGNEDVTAEARAKNALNATVLNQVRFAFRNRQITGATGF